MNQRAVGAVVSEEALYDRLRDAIASGQLMPNEHLVEADIVQRLGAGRTVVRMALARLAQERLVERLRNKGVRVRSVGEREAIEILEARVALECVAARQAAINATPDDVKRLRTILREMERRIDRADDIVAYTDTNVRFHREILRIAGNATVTRLVESLRSQINHYQNHRLSSPSRPDLRLKEHCRIADAITKNNPAVAEARMRDHLSSIVMRRRSRLETSKPVSSVI
jgi:DNA-binding GntR family transcriptional regulator